MKRLINSFRCAICGIINCFLSERNFRIHTFFAAAVITAGIIFKIRTYEWLTVFICISVVMAAECFNTAIEKMVDIYTVEYDERAKFIKDASAGGVLICAVFSLVVGIMIFGKYIVAYFV